MNVRLLLPTQMEKIPDQVINDKVLVRALERSIEIIGEAVNKIDDEIAK